MIYQMQNDKGENIYLMDQKTAIVHYHPSAIVYIEHQESIFKFIKAYRERHLRSILEAHQ